MESNIIKESVVFPLPPELVGIAAQELEETPATRRQCLTEIRKQLVQKHGEEHVQDDAFLLRFLRCRRFDVPSAISVYEGYFAFKRDNAKILRDLCPDDARHIWEAGVIGALPVRDRKGRAVMVAFPGRWDPVRHSLEDMMKAMFLQLEYLITSLETQITGIVLIADFTGFSFHQARSIKPWYFQHLASLVQNAFPARFKAVHILNQPWYISFIMSIVSRILSEKMQNRIQMLGDRKELLENSFDMSLLPTEFGGTAGNYDSLAWADTMTSPDTAESIGDIANKCL